MSTTASNDINTLVIIAIIAIIFYVRRNRVGKMRQKNNLGKRERTTGIGRQMLDPVFELLVVGGAPWTDLQHGWLPWLILLVGFAIGFPLGFVRGRFMYKGSIKESGKVILERNAAEIGILVVLIAIKTYAEHLHAKPTSPLILIVIGALGISLASSVGRVTYIYIKYKNEQDKGSTKPALNKR